MKISPEWPAMSAADKLICKANLILENGGNSETALNLYLEAMQTQDSDLVWRNLGRLYFQHKLWSDAEHCFKQAEAQTWLAAVYELTSRYDEAWAAINLAPQSVSQARLKGRIARFLGKYQAGIEALLPYDDVQGYFELARLYDKSGDYEKAWNAAVKGNLAKGDRCDDPFPDLPYRIPQENYPDKPVFIVGMPRSGTTLIERMISQHPRMETKGESEFFNIVADNLLQGRNVSDIGKAYLMKHADRTVDKTPMNLRHIDLIRGTFPNAKFIHMQRNPNDIALSCFLRHFDGNQPWAYDWNDIQNAIARSEELAAGKNLYAVRYEDLVSDTENVLRGVLDFCELDWNPDCLNHSADKTHHIGSYEEVRKPVHTDSINKSENYRPYFEKVQETVLV
jgi:tetratricopeptide (TPR) repeat protein